MNNEIRVVINGEGPLHSIFKVPNALVQWNENRYEPLVASFGPYHNQKKFEVPEDHKMLYVQNLIARRTPPTTYDTLIVDIETVKVKARACYAQKFEVHTAQVNSSTVDKFVEMMVIDGCFLLELLYKYKEHEKLLSDVAAAAEADRVADAMTVEGTATAAAVAAAAAIAKDPIFCSRRIICSVRRDMVLMENQLPLTVLHRLLTLTSDPNHNFPLAQLVGDFMAPIIPWTAVNGNYDVVNSHHLLDLLRRYLISTFVGTPLAQLVGDQDVRTSENQILSAVELSQGGIFIRSIDCGDLGPFGITIISLRGAPIDFLSRALTSPSMEPSLP